MTRDNEFDDQDRDDEQEEDSPELDIEQMRVFLAGKEDEGEVDLDLETAEAIPTKPELAEVLVDLEKGERAYLGLYAFSDLTAAELALLETRWPLIDAALRASVVREAMDLLIDNIHFAFTRLFLFASSDEEPEVRMLATAALGYDHQDEVAERLLEIVHNDPSEDVRAEAAISLGPFVTLAEWDELPPDMDSRLSQVLFGIAENEVETWHIRSRAATSIAARGPSERVNRLVQLMYDEDEIGLRASALCAAGRGNQRDWLPVVIEEFGNEDPEIRREAARSAGMFGDRDALPGLSEMATGDEDTDARQTAILAIGEIGGKEAIRMLLRLQLYAPEGDAAIVADALEEAELFSNPFGRMYGGS